MATVIAIPVVVFLLIITVLTLAAFRPSRFRIVRDLKVAAPAASVFRHLDDLRLMDAWNPWFKEDRTCITTYDGPGHGVGAISVWSGRGKAGAGRAEIAESIRDSRVTLRIEYARPFSSTCTAQFHLYPERDGTRVVWALDGRNNYQHRVVGLFLNMDKLIGGMFERGLRDLKDIVER